jgi:zinc protease
MIFMAMIKKLPLLFFIVLVLACTLLISSQKITGFNDNLPIRTDIQRGVLDNGMQYIVLPNDKPAQQVSLQLVVKAGSLHEQEDQKGIAHLVEHMAFNGTEQYPGNSIIEHQESLGMVFGRDVNATTSFHTTTYFSHLPNNKSEVMDEAFNMLAQQASNLTFDQKELEKERPVVEEEWRRNLSMRSRLTTATSAITKANSRFVKRLPIGDMELVRHVDANRVKAFWLDWYHPNNMVLIAVGATNEEQIKSLLSKHFENMPSAKLPDLPNTDIPLSSTMSFEIVSDKEINTEVMSINFRAQVPVVKTVDGYKRQLISELAMHLMSDRLRHQYKSGGEYVSKMSINSYNLAQGYDNTRLFAILKNEQYDKALKEVFTELSRYATHGFTIAELESVKQVLHRSYQTRIDNKGALKNKMLLRTLYSQLLNNAPFTASIDKAKLAKTLLTEITLADVNKHFKNIIENRVPIVIAQVKPENITKQPVLEQVASMWIQAKTAPPPARVGVNVDAPLFSKKLSDVEIISHKMLGNNHIWTLKNETEIWFQPSNKLPDSLLVRWQGIGGTQHFSENERRTAQLAVRSMASFGYGGFDVFQLELLNAGTRFNLGASVNQLQHQLSGSSTKDSFETWLKNFYLKVTEPQIDEAIWDSNKELMLKGLKGAHKSPQRQFSKELTAVLYPNNSILLPLTAEELLPISADKLIPAWQKVFNHSAKHQLLIVGNAEPDWVIEKAARYIGNLPTGQGKSEVPLPKIALGSKKIIVRAGIEPKAITELFWVTDHSYQQIAKREAGLVSKLINLRMREQLREVAGGVYSSKFNFSLDKYRGQLFASLSYAHEPERSVELKNIAM